jgi:hypothetical protein
MGPRSSIVKNLFGSLVYVHRFMGLLVGAPYCITYDFMCLSYVAYYYSMHKTIACNYYFIMGLYLMHHMLLFLCSFLFRLFIPRYMGPYISLPGIETTFGVLLLCHAPLFYASK